MRSNTTHLRAVALALVGGLLTCCGSPNQANIQLRKDKQQLQSQIDQLQIELSAERARLAGLESSVGVLPTLPATRLASMYTVQAIKLGRFTGAADLDPGRPGDEGLKVYLTPQDETGEIMKATGQVVVEALDPESAGGARIGRWEFGPAQMKEAWRNLGPLHAFVFTIPWQQAPAHSNIVIRVTFQDDLTGRLYSAVREATVQLPPTPATQPAVRP